MASVNEYDIELFISGQTGKVIVGGAVEHGSTIDVHRHLGFGIDLVKVDVVSHTQFQVRTLLYVF
jgi:hypothetical protein